MGIGGGFRLNYLGLDGGYSGLRYSDNYKFKLNYKDIDMDNYSPSFAIAFGGWYKKWNLSFAGSRGSYKGDFKTKFDIVRDDIQIDSGALVNGTIDMGIYALTTTFAGDNWSYSTSLGFRQLFMDMYMENDMGWAKEKDIYNGPYISIRAKFSSLEKLTYVKRKDRKKQ